MSQKYSPILVVFLVIAAFAIGSMWTKIQYLQSGVGSPESAAKTQPAAAPAQPTAPSAQGGPTKVNVTINPTDPFLGSPNAKVTLVEFSDFQCPFCERFFTQTWPQIKTNYVDTGKVKFVYKNLAFLGQESTDAANAAMCAKEQNKYWEYHDKLFNSQQGENQGAFKVDNLKKFAADLGLNTTQFNSCLDANKYNAQVQADTKMANDNGFNSTPSFAVGSTPLVGAQPFAQFKTIVDSELAK